MFPAGFTWAALWDVVDGIMSSGPTPFVLMFIVGLSLVGWTLSVIIGALAGVRNRSKGGGGASSGSTYPE